MMYIPISGPNITNKGNPKGGISGILPYDATSAKFTFDDATPYQQV